ncbi:hypothetical protein PoB_003685700, partial [Plakobranchus ocellatus]
NEITGKHCFQSLVRLFSGKKTMKYSDITTPVLMILVGIMTSAHLDRYGIVNATYFYHHLENVVVPNDSTPFVDLKSIERNPVPEGINVTIRFTKNIQNLAIVYQNSSDFPKELDTFEEESDENWVANFVLKNRSNWIIFGNKDEL